VRGGNGGLRERGRRSWQKIEEVPKVRHKTVSIYSLKVFYREAGDPMNPKVILLGGFPSSSHFAVEDSLQTIASNIQRFYREQVAPARRSMAGTP
jgi:pimeloyl-ACP methyl ester carboxylesterase